MSGRGAIRLGDSHSGGGTMIEASGFPVDGIPQCLLGDKAQCPKCKGTYPLVSGGDGTTIQNGPHGVRARAARLRLHCLIILHGALRQSVAPRFTPHRKWARIKPYAVSSRSSCRLIRSQQIAVITSFRLAAETASTADPPSDARGCSNAW